MPEGYEIDDPQPIAAEAPYTFFLPTTTRLAAIQIGDLVKLTIRGIPEGDQYDAERMWVTVTAIERDTMAGELANEPFDIPHLKPGHNIEFRRSDIIDVELDGEERDGIGLTERRTFWDRCLVDRCVVDDGIRVGYVYREKSDMGDPEDKYPDSGWRIRGEQGSDTNRDMADRKSEYIALGAVLNRDDSWLHLIDEPIGTAWLRNPETGEFEPDK